MEEVAHLAAERRAQGLLLVEPDGNPDPLLEQGRTQHAALLQALDCGDTKAAAGHRDQALASAEQAQTAIERQVAAREQAAREITARRAEAHSLQRALSTAQGQRNELEHSFAPESWHAVADNLTRARELQSTADRLLEESAAVAGESVQHYFRACSLLEQVQHQQEQAQAQLQEVGRCLDKLTALRQECLHRRDELLDLARRVQDFCARNAAAVRQPAHTRRDAADGRWRAARGQLESQRPHWPMIQQQLEASRREYAAVLQEAESDVRDHQQFAARLAETGRDAERVAQFLRQHHEDRPQANERYRSAADLLERVRRDSAGRGADWKQLLRQVEEAAGLLKQAEELARQDLQLAERAAAEIDAAERELLRARNFFELGISADLTKAEALLAQARRELANQAYEQAISQAGSAQQAARQAHAEAAQRAQQEQQRLEQERQRAEAAAAAQYAVPPGQTTTPGTPEWLNTTGSDLNPPTAGPRQIEV